MPSASVPAVGQRSPAPGEAPLRSDATRSSVGATTRTPPIPQEQAVVGQHPLAEASQTLRPVGAAVVPDGETLPQSVEEWPLAPRAPPDSVLTHNGRESPAPVAARSDATRAEAERTPTGPPPSTIVETRSVVGSMSSAAEAWRRAGAPARICWCLERGLDWTVSGSSPKPRRDVLSRSPEATRFVDQEIQRLMQEGALVEAPVRATSAIFVVPKDGDSFRMVVDMRGVNQLLQPAPPAFKYAGLPQVAKMVDPGDWMVTIDLKSGYHQVRVADSLSEWLGIRWRGRSLRFAVLPFGLAAAPYWFTRVMAAALAIMRSRGLRASAYLDDLIFTAPSRAEMLRLREEVLVPTLRELGIVRSPTKGSWEPSQRVRYLGLMVDAENFRFGIPEDRRAELASLLGRLARFQPGETIQARFLARIAGKLAFLCQAVSLLRQAIWSLYEALKPLYKDPLRWGARVALTQAALEDARWLSRNLGRLPGDPLRRPEQLLVVTTDASDAGWSCTLETTPAHSAAGGWTSAQRARHIQEREMLAVLFGMFRLRSHIAGRRVLIRSDNTAVVAYLRKKGGMRSPALRDLTRKVLTTCMRVQASIVAVEWLSTKENVLADYLSRKPWEVLSDWCVRPEVFQRLVRRWGWRDFDLFASPETTKTRRFASAAPFPEAAVRDAFTISWSDLRAWAAPPLGLVERVASAVLAARRDGSPLDLILLVPFWPERWWWRPLEAAARDVLQLGLASEVVLETAHTELAKNEAWRMAAMWF